MTVRADAKRRRAAVRLAIASAVLAALAVAVVGRDLATQRVRPVGGPVLPDWSGQVADASRIEVRGGDGALTLARGAEGWRLEERGGYPVSDDALDEFEQSFAGLVRAGASTRDPDNHARLGVRDPAEGGAGAGTGVRILADDGAEIVSLILGASRDGGVFARFPEDDEAFAVDGETPDVDAPSFWLDLDFLEIAREDIARVEITPEGGGVTYRLARASRTAEDFEIASPPSGWTLMTRGAANGPGGAVAALRFADVAPDQDFTGSLVARHVATTFDGLTITLDIFAVGQERWAEVSADASDIVNATTPEARRAADRIETLTEGWVYLLPEFGGDRLARPLDRIARVEEG